MLSREELRQRKTQFWAEFKAIMSLHRSVNGRKMNWLNYPTDIKNVYIRLDADKNGARMTFDIQFKDAGIREIFWEQLGELKKVLDDAMPSEGEWIFDCYSPNIDSFSRILWEKKGINFFQDADHQAFFDFFKDHLLAFDEFYQNFNAILINLVD